MTRVKFWLLGLGAVVVPVLLVSAAVAISNGFDTDANIPGLDVRQERTTSTDSSSRRTPGSSPSPHATASPSLSVDDHSGRCSEPEHQSDPECVSGTDTSGSSGSSSGSDSSGPGGGDDSGSDNSGPSGSSGSSGSSGPGSGDD